MTNTAGFTKQKKNIKLRMKRELNLDFHSKQSKFME